MNSKITLISKHWQHSIEMTINIFFPRILLQYQRLRYNRLFLSVPRFI
ncbi:hypothetical protein HMPREF1002_04817 [Porphyromonas sp. 31_2]|nr:hypothetical protein HMPREF1002_04817 [Porphyromonas sp. 31_2]